ncbi:hypothetical protein DSLASN_17770 [Desulfoluna limicola]|uniref:Uncharacterized protein n=1 Tax=Desulfoluna limicola TaxID=2810562 RepID=A0ABM7PEW0_9BACT|nr:SidJ-related pseudokinase [Desulfoluna limicola]BCS96145.1 hypothetical protein DSLASN_17770 [Desulfoluna limicola]
MTTSAEDIERLFSASRGYNALFLAAGALENACDENPECLTERGVRLLLDTLADDRFEPRRTSLFFYGRLARVLTRTAGQLGPQHPIAHMSLDGLTALANHATGNRHTAICAACAPLAPRNTSIPQPETTDCPTPCTCRDLLEEAGLSRYTTPTHSGRSLRYEDKGTILVIKCARPGEDPRGLSSEWHWMRLLGSHDSQGGHIPTPLRAPLLRITGLPKGAASDTAIAFLTSPTYFSYPNEPLAPMETPLATKVIGDAAFFFGRLASHGILHTAPVPLFHNRVQVDRRDDEGLYLWQKGGRLDSWLTSCRYPNFGLSGLRDFEHMKTAPEMISGEFYRTMGDQILSLLLVSGSHFRSLAPCPPHHPCPTERDHRPLFDLESLGAMLTAIANGYHRGYTGRSTPFPHEAVRERLASRMIEEMGRDRHMEEILRARDQMTMDEADLRNFLIDRGYSSEGAENIPKGAADIVLFTGPHLGRFNGKISCPELIEFTATLASITITNGFLAMAS